MTSFLSDAEILNYVQQGQQLFADNWPMAVALFCGLHLVASLVGIPGGCTALNFIAGAVFGFFLGCAIVYPVTILSAVLAYGAGRAFSGRPLAERLQKFIARISVRLGHGDFLFFVSLRLSPLFPFGLLNLACGWLKIPFGLFITSTTVGIFFDVTVLNSLGAAVRVAGSGQAGLEKTWLFAAFALLLTAFWVMRSLLLNKKERMRLGL